jgi:hypothetical protein
MKVRILGKQEPPEFNPSVVDESIIEATRQRRLVLLVGSGLSRQAVNCPPECFPNWTDLLMSLNDLNDSLGRRFSSEALEIDELIKRGEYLMAAQHLKQSIPKKRYEGLLKRKFEPIGAKPGPIHYAIIHLNPPFILTTNYDALLETALRKTYVGVETCVFTGDRSDLVLDRYKEAHSSTRPFILKLHGSINDVDNIVLTHDSYVSLYNQREYQDLLTSVFLNYTVLMLGFSMSDPELLHFLGSLHARFNKRVPNSFLFTSNMPTTSVKSQRLEDDFGVRVINYPKDAHSHVLDLVNYLKSFVELTDSTNQYDEPKESN